MISKIAWKGHYKESIARNNGELRFEIESFAVREEYVRRYSEEDHDTEDDGLRHRRLQQIEKETGKKFGNLDFLDFSKDYDE